MWSSARLRRNLLTMALTGPEQPDLVVAPDPSQLWWVIAPPALAESQSTTSTSSTRPFRTAQITSPCFVSTASLFCMR